MSMRSRGSEGLAMAETLPASPGGPPPHLYTLRMPEHRIADGFRARPMGCRRVVAALVLLAGTVGCGAAQRAATPATPSVASFNAVPADWPTLTDATYGYTLRYPAGWTQQFDQPAGFHALSNRGDLTNLLELQATDYWLVAQAGARDPAAGCGEPAGRPAEKTATTLGGQPATRYVITGTRGAMVEHIVEVFSVRGSTCFTLQLVAGGTIPLDHVLATVSEIQSSYHAGRGA
jgi:hypothetical protein